MNILFIGDIVRSGDNYDMVIGFTQADKVMLASGGISDQKHFDVIGHYNSVEVKLTIFGER